jgi:hypothetical protein
MRSLRRRERRSRSAALAGLRRAFALSLARSGGPGQIGEPGMALTVGAARRLAAVAECVEIARIAARPATGAFRQVDDREPPVDRLLIGEIDDVAFAAPYSLGGGDVHYVSVWIHFVLWNVEGKRLAASGT